MKRSFEDMQALIEKEKKTVQTSLKKLKKEMNYLQKKLRVLDTFSDSNYFKVRKQFKTKKDEIIRKIANLTPLTSVQHEYNDMGCMDKYCIHGFSILKIQETWFQLVRVETENCLTWDEIAPYHGNSVQLVVDKMKNGSGWFEDCAKCFFPKTLRYLNKIE